MRVYFLTLTLLSFSLPVFANEDAGLKTRFLYEMCTKKQYQGACSGYFDGYYEAASVLAPGTISCLIEKEPSLDTLIKVFVRYVDENPETLEDFKAKTVYESQKDAFC